MKTLGLIFMGLGIVGLFTIGWAFWGATEGKTDYAATTVGSAGVEMVPGPEHGFRQKETPPPVQPIVISGKGQTNTEPFFLPGSAYRVQYDYSGECYYAADLKRVAGSGQLPASLGTGMGPVKSRTNLYHVRGGQYYVDMITGPAPRCPWSISLSPR